MKVEARGVFHITNIPLQIFYSSFASKDMKKPS
jgi:hypothetical protein